LLQTAVLPAWVFLGLWFLLQTVQGLMALGMDAVGGVAWWAHIGGFVAGLAFAAVLRTQQRLRPAPRVIALSGGSYRRM
jgi:membrane associated rhomboid family serine protease